MRLYSLDRALCLNNIIIASFIFVDYIALLSLFIPTLNISNRRNYEFQESG
jgi:hypothetical protein